MRPIPLNKNSLKFRFLLKWILAAMFFASIVTNLIELTKSFEVIHIFYLLYATLFLVSTSKIDLKTDFDSTARTSAVVFLHATFPLSLIAVTMDPNPAFNLKYLSNIGILGSLISLISLIDLGKSFAIFPSQTCVVSTGGYKLIRHPIYLGYILVLTSKVLLAVNPTSFLILLIFIVLTVARINLEETFMRQQKAYRDYCKQVRYRVLPGVY